MFEIYISISNKLFGWVPDKYFDLFKGLSSILPKSGINLPTRNYAAVICFTSFLGFFVGIPLSLSLISLLKLSTFTNIGIAIFFPILFSMLVFLTMYTYPYQKAFGRRTSIDTNLPFAIAHMGSIATSGIPPSAIFKLLSKFEEYGSLAEEMQKIVRNMEMFGMDPMSSIREVAKRSPSEKFKQILMGFVSTIEGGGDLKTYLKVMGEQTLFTWKNKRAKYLQQLSAYAEFYTGLLIAAPLFIISLFSVMNMIEPNLGGFSILFLMKLSIYILIPVLNIGFLLFLKSTQVDM